jgi:phospholipid/cholesterol/gamma-HCH transport system permease protein
MNNNNKTFLQKIGFTVSLIGEKLIDIVTFSGFTIMLMLKSFYYLKYLHRRGGEVIRQMYYAGVKTFIVISIVALFTGMILTLQTGLAMRTYHMEDMVGGILIATLTKEMGPFSAAIILIASVGSTMAAEIGTMKVSEEIDALNLMSINPIYYLVMPRVVALAVMLPIATIYVIALGVVGGALIASSQLNISFENYYYRVIEALHFKDVYVGLFKSFVFGIMISSVSCAQGLRATNGVIGVGKATRDSVVASFLLVLIIGYYITALFYRINP